MSGLDRIKEKLAEINAQKEQKPSTGNNNSTKWKPTEGKHQIRILPNKYGEPGYPFTEMYFHYGNFGKTYLSPLTFDEPDPVIDYCQKLTEKRLSTDEFKTAMNLKKKLLPNVTNNQNLPSFRVYVPILVRGKENEGVKFWDFGKKIFIELLGAMSDDYGDISDLKEGRDLTVEVTKISGKEYPDITVRIKPNTSKATDDPEVLKSIENMIDIKTQFTKPTYDELKDLLKKYLSDEPIKSEDAPKSTVGTSTKPNHEATNEGFDVKIEIPESKPSQVEKNADTEDLMSQFEAILNKK